MRIKAPLFALFFLTFFSCEKKEITNEEPIIEEPIVEDKEKPVLTVTGFTDIIETTTEISIEIVDASTVETKVLHDGEELATSAEKQMNVSINPYAMPVGSTDFVLVSKDAKGNEISETYSVEIKHLLMSFELNSQEYENGQNKWLFFNSLEGNELAVIETTVGTSKIYTDEIILDDKIWYSSVRYREFTYGSGHDVQVHLATYKIPLGSSRPQPIWNESIELENTVEVTLKDIPFVNGQTDYIAFGKNYNTTSYTGDDQQTKLTIKHDATQPIYIRANRWGSTPKFDGKKENYRFIVLTPEAGNTIIEVEANQLMPAENNIKLHIPDHEPGTLFFTRAAYENTENFDLNKHYAIYGMDALNTNEIPNYLDLPKFSTLNYYVNNLSYRKNGSYYSTLGTDDNLDVDMPNWPTILNVTDDSIELTADNPEVDYYFVELEKRMSENGEGRVMGWKFNIFGEDDSTKIALRLQIPESILEAIGDPYFQNTHDLEIYRLTAIDYLKFDTYNEIIEWLVFNQNAPSVGDNEYRQINYSSSSYSGKSDVDNRLWNIGDRPYYGLNEKEKLRKK